MANDIKILDHLNIDLDGDGIAERYEIGGISELPIASSEVLGGVKIGENLTITEDGTLNAEASGTSVLSPGAILYDTEEKVIGKWINGKPLYEKTFKTTVNVTGSTEYFSNVIVEDAEEYFIKNAFCTENENGTGAIQMIGSINFNGNYDYNITSFNLNTGRWWIIRGGGTSPYTTIIVRYTKTTD